MSGHLDSLKLAWELVSQRSASGELTCLGLSARSRLRRIDPAHTY